MPRPHPCSHLRPLLRPRLSLCRLVPLAICILSSQNQAQAWQHWNYTHHNNTRTTDDWRDIWGFKSGPRNRVGHSMLVYQDSKVILFGGRDNEVHRPHVPKTYDLSLDSGSNGYKDNDADFFKPLLPGYDQTCHPTKTCIGLTAASSGNNESCTYSWDHMLNDNLYKDNEDDDEHFHQSDTDKRRNVEEACGFSPATQFYNDIWVYDLDCERHADVPCTAADGGWRVLHPGKRFGGCRDVDDDNHDNDNDGDSALYDGLRFCDVPSERHGHGAAMLGNGETSIMIIYGGSSQECEDYCEDVWAFDFSAQMDRMGSLGKGENKWKRIMHAADPGKRWKFSMVSGKRKQTEKDENYGNWNGSEGGNDDVDIIIVFGGHRLWHGFADENSQENRWNNTKTYPEGGFLNDLWFLEKAAIDRDEGELTGIDETKSRINSDGESNNNGSGNGTDADEIHWQWKWIKQVPKESCVPSPGIAWEDRNKVRCEVYWPQPRSGHAATFDKVRRRLWVHGGYTARYPYPASSSSGSGAGVKNLREKGFTPYGSNAHFLDDLWYYKIDTGIWTKIRPSDSVSPTMRTNHLMIHTRNILLLYGGYSDNHYFNDTWYFEIEKNRWLEKKSFVHAIYPTNCTDDITKVEEDEDCVELEFPRPLQRAGTKTYDIEYQGVIPYPQQPGYTPDPEYPLYFGIVNDAETLVSNLRSRYLFNELYDERGNRIWIKSDVPDGTPIAPSAATAPRQYAKKRRMNLNETLTLDIWEWCVSVEGEPTRGKVTDGKFGKAKEPVRIPQPRRNTLGWDGCREMRWVFPQSRSGHKGVILEKYDKVVLYGGISYLHDNHHSDDHPVAGLINITYDTEVVSDMWTYGIDTCPRNCSGVGACTNGYCECQMGYYGLDCSNTTCPGSVCYYDENHEQHCEHCCYDGYMHNADHDDYTADIRKIPCRPLGDSIFSGQSNGICDGFGTCQCAPPFVGDDCSIRDCPNNCNGNGFCSMEFPVARCICEEGYKGDACQYLECLNNCTYPNGKCDHRTGECVCKPIYSPHNSSEIWTYWDGQDCSFLLPWCGACKKRLNLCIIVVVVSLVISSASL